MQLLALPRLAHKPGMMLQAHCTTPPRTRRHEAAAAGAALHNTVSRVQAQLAAEGAEVRPQHIKQLQRGAPSEQSSD